MSNIATRVYVVVGIIAAASLVSYLVQAAIEPPEPEKPAWSISELPIRLGNWEGEDTEMDPTIAAATGAYAITNRIYRDDRGRALSLHTAMFTDPAEGVYHTPFNCYRSNGWTRKSESDEEIKIDDHRSIPIKLTTWEKDHDKILVAFWYQLGPHILYSRADLGSSVRWKMRGFEKWPVLVKVMVQVPASDPIEAKSVVLEFGNLLSGWLNSPEHLQYFDRWNRD